MNSQACFLWAFLLLASLKNECNAQFQLTKNREGKDLIIQVMDHIYNFEFDEASKKIPGVYKIYPNHPVGDFLEAMSLYWQIIPLSKEHPLFSKYVLHIENVLKLGKNLLSKPEYTEEAYYFLLAAHSSLTLVEVKQKNYLSAIAEAQQSYEYMRKGFDLLHKNPEFHFSTGLYHFYAEQYPKTHPFLKPFMYFFAKGSISYGLEQLEKGSIAGEFTANESCYFVAHVNLKYLNDPDKAYQYLKKLRERYPQNLWYLSRYIECLIILKRFQEAETLIPELEHSSKENYIFSAQLFRGMLYQFEYKNLQKAKYHYLIAKDMAEHQLKHINDYVAFVYCYLALIYEQEKNKKLSDYFMQRAEETSEYESIRNEIKAYKRRNEH